MIVSLGLYLPDFPSKELRDLYTFQSHGFNILRLLMRVKSGLIKSWIE